MFSLIASVVGIAVLAAAFYAYNLGQQDIGAKKQKALDLIVATALEVERDVARTDAKTAERERDQVILANKDLAADLLELGKQRDKCTDSVKRYQRIGAKSEADKQARQPALDAELAALRLDKLNMIAGLSKPDPGGTCEEREARNIKLLRGVAEERAKTYPKGVPTAPDAAAKDVLRIAPETPVRPPPRNPLAPR